MAQYQFVMRSGPNPGKVYPLEQVELTIGRDTSNVISINDAEVSRKHAKLTLRGNEYVIEDLGSTNGTFISGQRLSGPYTLRPGDLVSLGENIVLMFEATSDPNATMIASKKAVAAAVPAPAPAPAPVPPPAYSGQVPVAAAPTTPSKSSAKTILLIVGGIVLLCACAFSIYLYFAPESFWCATVPFLFPAGACP